MEAIQSVKASSLIRNWDLWPRQSSQKLDVTNLNRMKEALKAGRILPPIIVDRKSNNIVDGFHRHAAKLSVYGDDADVEVIFRDYKSESDIFLDAGALNASQGLTLNQKDRAYFIAKCISMNVAPKKIALALNMDVEAVDKFFKGRTAINSVGEVIPLGAGAKNLAGKVLTKEQENYARQSTGYDPGHYVSILINALKADAVVLSEATIKRLRDLYLIIKEVIGE